MIRRKPMPTFVTVHRSPGLSPEEIQANGALVAESEYATFKHLYVDMFQGFLVSVYEGESQESVEREFERVGFPWDEIHEVQVDLDDALLRASITGAVQP
jgi:hypothetical protein